MAEFWRWVGVGLLLTSGCTAKFQFPVRAVYYLFVGCEVGDRLEVYSVNRDTGALTLASSVSGVKATGIAVDSSRKEVYVADGNTNNVNIYDFDVFTGALTSKLSLDGAAGPKSLLLDVERARLFVLSDTSERLSSFLRAGDNWNLVSSTAVTNNEPSLALSPDGYTLVASTGVGLASLHVDHDGSFGTVQTQTIASGSRSVVVHPSGRWAYLALHISSLVKVYEISTDGSGTLIDTGASVSVSNPLQMILDETARYLLVSSLTGQTVHRFVVDGDSGGLTAVGSAVAAGAPQYTIAGLAGFPFFFTTGRSISAIQAFSSFGDVMNMSSQGSTTTAAAGPEAMVLRRFVIPVTGD
ncbi:MAG: beta-propeller fold lactonase family protein [Bacteriovoracia bacterium]